MTGTLLIVAGASVFMLLGARHFSYALSDLKEPKYFAPADRDLLAAMKLTTVRLSKKAKNFWLSSLGFHFSHAVGVMFYAAATIYVALGDPQLLSDPLIDAAIVGVGASYVVMAHFFWFSIPLIGTALGTGLMAAGMLIINVN
ncbi:MAG: hypothetical protein WD076_02785 [Parvularculaceae bacterium]